MASCSWTVTCGPKCVLGARTNLGWIPIGGTAGRMVAAANQAAEEGYRILRNDQISARKSALRSEQVARSEKGQPELVVRAGLLMLGRLDTVRTFLRRHLGLGSALAADPQSSSR